MGMLISMANIILDGAQFIHTSTLDIYRMPSSGSGHQIGSGHEYEKYAGLAPPKGSNLEMHSGVHLFQEGLSLSLPHAALAERERDYDEDPFAGLSS